MAKPDAVDGAAGTATATNNDSIAKQEALLAESLRVNTAMAWLQMAIGLTGKISGR